MKFIRTFTAMLAMLSVVHCIAQNSPAFIEKITEDSINVFFNSHYEFTPKGCADFTRYIHVNAEGKYDSYFEDVDVRYDPIGKGTYVDGRMDGLFELYFPNGKVKSKGVFKLGIPYGKWEFFYENGLPERTLEISDTDTLVTRWVNVNGEILVDHGNGTFSGAIVHGDLQLSVHGHIENGLPDGRWTESTTGNYCEENYSHGKFTGGILRALKDPVLNHYQQPILTKFFPRTYLSELEESFVGNCSDTAYYRQLPGRMELLSKKINKWFKDDRKSLYRTSYAGGPVVIFQFLVDKTGNAGNFVTISNGGERLKEPITKMIRETMMFKKEAKVMYFHMMYHAVQGGQFSFRFSAEPSF